MLKSFVCYLHDINKPGLKKEPNTLADFKPNGQKSIKNCLKPTLLNSKVFKFPNRKKQNILTIPDKTRKNYAKVQPRKIYPKFNIKIIFAQHETEQTSIILRVRHEGFLHGLGSHHAVFLLHRDRGCRSDGCLCNHLQRLDHTDVAQFVRYRQSCLAILQQSI